MGAFITYRFSVYLTNNFNEWAAFILGSKVIYYLGSHYEGLCYYFDDIDENSAWRPN